AKIGKSSPARIAMMAMTTRSSISVNAGLRLEADDAGPRNGLIFLSPGSRRRPPGAAIARLGWIIAYGGAIVLLELAPRGGTAAGRAARGRRQTTAQRGTGRGRWRRMHQKLPKQDVRLTVARTQDEGAGFRPPASREEWERRRAELREQI